MQTLDQGKAGRMSVLIKDMKMPKSCYECKLDIRTDVCLAFSEWNKEHPYSIRATDRLPDCPLSEVPEPQWIPCHDPSDLPKDKRIWITYECDVCGYVFRFVKDVVWDMTEWSDNVSGVVAYMPYVEPEPYEESGRKE